MAGVGIEDYGAFFIQYLPDYVKTHNEVEAIANIPLGKTKWRGEKVVKKVKVKRNTAMTYTADGGHIPVAKRQGYVESEGSRKFFVAQVAVSEGILANADTTESAALTYVDSEIRGVMETAKTFRNVMFSRDGSGVVGLLGATVSTAAFATTPITVDDARGMFEDGEFEIRDATTPATIHADFEVSSVPRARVAGESQVYLKANLAAAGQAQGDYICWGRGVDSAYGKAITGLDRLIDDAAVVFQGVNCATYPRYTSPVSDGGGVAQNMTPALIRNHMATLAQEMGQESMRPLLVYTSTWDAKNFEELFESELRIAPTTRIGGIKVPTFQSSFGEFSIMTDPHCPYGVMFFIDRTEISWLKQRELDWRPTGGPSGIFTTQQGYLGYVASCCAIEDLFIENRRTSGKITNLNVTVGSAY
jgi:hypothetical protein